MQNGHGLRGYFYEYILHQVIEATRESSSHTIPISQAKSIRRQVDEHLARVDSQMSLQHPKLGISAALEAIDTTMASRLEQYQPYFAEHSGKDPQYLALQSDFSQLTGRAKAPAGLEPTLPISPYDPRWSSRASVRRAGTELVHLREADIDAASDGRVEQLDRPEFGNLELQVRDVNGALELLGDAYTHEDAAGLSVLMDKMSTAEYNDVRSWVLAGARDSSTGQIDPNKFMSTAAIERSAAVLEDLKSRGVSYKVARDRVPGQIKARLDGTGLEVRITDLEREDFAGARFYDNGVETRYSTTVKAGRDRSAQYASSPQEAVELLRFVQGQPVPRRDDPSLMVGQISSLHSGSSAPEANQAAYYVERSTMFAVDDYIAEGETQPRPGAKVMIRREAQNRTLTRFFHDAEAAEVFGQAAVDTARENFRAQLNVEELIEAAHTEMDRAAVDGDEVKAPEFSADPEIAGIERAYWDVLTGTRSELLRPGATETMYRERLEAIGEMQADEQPDLANLAYVGTPEQKVRDHAEDVAFEIIGTWEPMAHDVDGELIDQRFDAGRVAKYMTNEDAEGQWTNLDNLAAAAREAGVPAEEIMGTGFQASRFKDRLASFDVAAAVDMESHASPFMRSMAQTVRQSLETNAMQVSSIQVDDKGIVHWEASRMGRRGALSPVTGQLGQIFDPGEHGEIVTQFASGENALVVPGYQARVAAQDPDAQPSSVEQRTMLRGYEQLMRERIQYQLSSDATTARSRVGEPASLNGVYSQLYGTKHPVDFIERAMEPGPDGQMVLNPWTQAIIDTESRRIRYSNEIKTGSTVYAEHKAARETLDPADDNSYDAWGATGGRNMVMLTGKDARGIEAPGGYFDPVMTGGATNQGIVRYLTADAQVDEQGRIVPGDPSTLTGSRAPLMTLPETAAMSYDPFDRQQMTTSTIMQSAKITEPTGTALMTFGGWTADDPIVVSDRFAVSHQIRGVDGQMRDLVVGDKLSDLHGNKGVISLIIDREMTAEEAAEQDLEQEVEWFKANPQMDVVMSPFSLISRRNAGAGRELMGSLQSETGHDLRSPDGAVTAAGVGEMRFVVTHMAVDEKTKVYDDEQVAAGRGRKASSQLGWALQSQQCPAIMREFYGHNAGAESNLREYLLVNGMDMEADGTLRVVGRDEAVGEAPQRRLIPKPELKLTKPKKGDPLPGLNTRAMQRDFAALIGTRGGDLEMPFPLNYPTGEPMEQASGTSWKMPVLSSHLRSGQEFDDGTTTTHDYTRKYEAIFMEACKYRHAAAAMSMSESPEKKAQHRKVMDTAVSRAQRSYDGIAEDIQHRVLEGKNNIFKTGIMSSRLSDSATMVWTADPRLDIDQVALSSVKAQQLGLAEDDYALIWRDPVLRDAGVRYMRVAIDDRLTGAAINPVMDACFDGDFDGDAVAVVKLHTEAAKAEAMEKLMVEANILDKGTVSERGTHPFAMQVSLDTQVALSKSPQLRKELDQLSGEANLNAVTPTSGNPELDASLLERNKQSDQALVAQLSGFYHDAQRSEFGSALSFADEKSHLASVKEICVDTGAKGSPKKLEDYARYLGTAEAPGITQQDQEASMFATAIKAHGTGLGGSFSQRAVRALRDTDLKAVLEVTYPVTQSILQAKHDAAEARHKYEMLQTSGRELWRGRVLDRVGNGQWKAQYEKGEPVQATREQWVEQFKDFYTSPDGFNVAVNPEFIDRVSRQLEDPASGLIRNLEDDKALKGSLLDQMAYSGSFKTLQEAAVSRESIYDSPRAAQFAPAPSYAALQLRESQLEALSQPQHQEQFEAPQTQASVIKADVMAETESGAKARGSSRRSAHAVAAGKRKPAPTPAPAAPATDDYEMEF
ncbi:hypothetical protein [Kocuria palustris]|uniref:hypothetical protein n=1 Tax=Kocuria palustris TaxID=71999 RepID=UPI00077B7381|nr:hypothetical protein [Kocuria palustris]